MASIRCVPLKIKFLDAAPRTAPCPRCGRDCRRKRTHRRRVTDIELCRGSVKLGCRPSAKTRCST